MKRRRGAVKYQVRLVDVSIHASVKRRQFPIALIVAGIGFDPRLREEATTANS